MLSVKYVQELGRDVGLLFSAFNKPNSYVRGAVEFLKAELNEEDLFEFKNYLRRVRSRATELDSSAIECPRPIDILAAVRAAQRAAKAVRGVEGCGCHDGWVTLFRYSIIRVWQKNDEGKFDTSNQIAKGRITDDVSARCSCAGGKFGPHTPWYKKLHIGEAGAYRGENSEEHARQWMERFLGAVDEWSPVAQSKHHIVTDWPFSKGDLISHLIEVGDWPKELTSKDR